ncbi:conserved Plasmodium protein, unknown function [Plasmodium sp. DRC-Itaito]|nr:conserved Plasmodium protein, unknown function [Plasmodium sp. DRC-Itaito]
MNNLERIKQRLEESVEKHKKRLLMTREKKKQNNLSICLNNKNVNKGKSKIILNDDKSICADNKIVTDTNICMNKNKLIENLRNTKSLLIKKRRSLSNMNKENNIVNKYDAKGQLKNKNIPLKKNTTSLINSNKGMTKYENKLINPTNLSYTIRNKIKGSINMSHVKEKEKKLKDEHDKENNTNNNNINDNMNTFQDVNISDNNNNSNSNNNSNNSNNNSNNSNSNNNNNNSNSNNSNNMNTFQDVSKDVRDNLNDLFRNFVNCQINNLYVITTDTNKIPNNKIFLSEGQKNVLELKNKNHSNGYDIKDDHSCDDNCSNYNNVYDNSYFMRKQRQDDNIKKIMNKNDMDDMIYVCSDERMSNNMVIKRNNINDNNKNNNYYYYHGDYNNKCSIHDNSIYETYEKNLKKLLEIEYNMKKKIERFEKYKDNNNNNIMSTKSSASSYPYGHDHGHDDDDDITLYSHICSNIQNVKNQIPFDQSNIDIPMMKSKNFIIKRMTSTSNIKSNHTTKKSLYKEDVNNNDNKNYDNNSYIFSHDEDCNELYSIQKNIYSKDIYNIGHVTDCNKNTSSKNGNNVEKNLYIHHDKICCLTSNMENKIIQKIKSDDDYKYKHINDQNNIIKKKNIDFNNYSYENNENTELDTMKSNQQNYSSNCYYNYCNEKKKKTEKEKLMKRKKKKKKKKKKKNNENEYIYMNNIKSNISFNNSKDDSSIYYSSYIEDKYLSSYNKDEEIIFDNHTCDHYIDESIKSQNNICHNNHIKIFNKETDEKPSCLEGFNQSVFLSNKIYSSNIDKENIKSFISNGTYEDGSIKEKKNSLNDKIEKREEEKVSYYLKENNLNDDKNIKEDSNINSDKSNQQNDDNYDQIQNSSIKKSKMTCLLLKNKINDSHMLYKENNINSINHCYICSYPIKKNEQKFIFNKGEEEKKGKENMDITHQNYDNYNNINPSYSSDNHMRSHLSYSSHSNINDEEKKSYSSTFTNKQKAFENYMSSHTVCLKRNNKQDVEEYHKGDNNNNNNNIYDNNIYYNHIHNNNIHNNNTYNHCYDQVTYNPKYKEKNVTQYLPQKHKVIYKKIYSNQINIHNNEYNHSEDEKYIYIKKENIPFKKEREKKDIFSYIKGMYLSPPSKKKKKKKIPLFQNEEYINEESSFNIQSNDINTYKINNNNNNILNKNNQTDHVENVKCYDTHDEDDDDDDNHHHYNNIKKQNNNKSQSSYVCSPSTSNSILRNNTESCVLKNYKQTDQKVKEDGQTINNNSEKKKNKTYIKTNSILLKKILKMKIESMKREKQDNKEKNNLNYINNEKEHIHYDDDNNNNINIQAIEDDHHDDDNNNNINIQAIVDHHHDDDNIIVNKNNNIIEMMSTKDKRITTPIDYNQQIHEKEYKNDICPNDNISNIKEQYSSIYTHSDMNKDTLKYNNISIYENKASNDFISSNDYYINKNEKKTTNGDKENNINNYNNMNVKDNISASYHMNNNIKDVIKFNESYYCYLKNVEKNDIYPNSEEPITKEDKTKLFIAYLKDKKKNETQEKDNKTDKYLLKYNIEYFKLAQFFSQDYHLFNNYIKHVDQKLSNKNNNHIDNLDETAFSIIKLFNSKKNDLYEKYENKNISQKNEIFYNIQKIKNQKGNIIEEHIQVVNHNENKIIDDKRKQIYRMEKNQKKSTFLRDKNVTYNYPCDDQLNNNKKEIHISTKEKNYADNKNKTTHCYKIVNNVKPSLFYKEEPTKINQNNRIMPNEKKGKKKQIFLKTIDLLEKYEKISAK